MGTDPQGNANSVCIFRIVTVLYIFSTSPTRLHERNCCLQRELVTSISTVIHGRIRVLCLPYCLPYSHI